MVCVLPFLIPFSFYPASLPFLFPFPTHPHPPHVPNHYLHIFLTYSFPHSLHRHTPRLYGTAPRNGDILPHAPRRRHRARDDGCGDGDGKSFPHFTKGASVFGGCEELAGEWDGKGEKRIGEADFSVIDVGRRIKAAKTGTQMFEMYSTFRVLG